MILTRALLETSAPIPAHLRSLNKKNMAAESHSIYTKKRKNRKTCRIQFDYRQFSIVHWQLFLSDIASCVLVRSFCFRDAVQAMHLLRGSLAQCVHSSTRHRAIEPPVPACLPGRVDLVFLDGRKLASAKETKGVGSQFRGSMYEGILLQGKPTEMR